MQTITLEEHLLDAGSENTKIEASPLLSNLEIELDSNIISINERNDAKKYVRKIAGIYGGVFNSLFLKLKEKENPEFMRAYFSYIASSVVLSFADSGKINNNFIFDIPFSDTDRKTLISTLKNLTESLYDSYSFNAVRKNTSSFFNSLSDYLSSYLNYQRFDDLREKYKDLKVKGPNFEVKGIEKILVEEKIKTKPEIIPFSFSDVKKEDIVGNKIAVKTAESSVNCLMHYSNGENPFFGFDQFLAFLGKPGTGKTMVAHYAMSLAKDIADKNNIPVMISELNFESEYQYGPILNLRSHLKEISKGDKINIVYIDEFDSKFPSRDSINNGSYKSEIVGEFLRFRGGAYPNKGNYLFLLTSNRPSDIDSAIFRVFNPIYVPGPLSTEERLEVLQKNLSKGIKNGYVQIDNWKKIYSVLQDNELTGADISKIATRSEEKFRSMALEIPFNASLNDKSRLIKTKSEKYITKDEDLIRSISEFRYSQDIKGECYA